MSFSPGHVKGAIVTMRNNRWRSLLTVFGIIVGVASVIVIIGISQGVKNQITSQVNAYSKNVITISSKAANLFNFGISSVPAVSTLTKQDANALSKIRGVAASVPLYVLSGVAKGDNSYPSGLVIATNQNLPLVINQSLDFGSFFNNQTSNNFGAVLGYNAAAKLFNGSIPLGYSFNWRGQQFLVDGVLNKFNATPFSNNTIYNDAIFISDKASAQFTGGSGSLFQILIKAKKGASLSLLSTSIKKTLLRTHGGQKNFQVLLPSQIVSNNSGILGLLTELTIGIAIISLFLGGVGIMNVMLVSVTERMHEIGIRKAIGASNRQILMQFLIESTAVSIVGGAIGIILALIIDGVLKAATSLNPVLSWKIVILTALVSIIIGIVFGSVPAYRASKKEPIDALRND